MRVPNATTMLPKIILVLCIIQLLVTLGQCEDCSFTEKGTDETPTPDCPEGANEIYIEDGKRYCCKAGTVGEKRAIVDADDCRTTGCNQLGTKGYYCGTYKNRTVNGREFGWEPAVEDECTTSSKEEGYTGVCCPKGGTQILLTTLAGAEIHQFPHFARVMNMKKGELCGGTIYNERYIITASHCVVEKSKFKARSASDFTVTVDILTNRFGKTISKDKTYDVEEIIVHPDSYLLENPRSSKAKHDDIALVKVGRDIEFGDNVKAIPIAPSDFDPFKYADHVLAIGFGTTDVLKPSKKLQKTYLKLRSDDDATVPTKWGKRYKAYADQIIFVGGIMGKDKSPNSGQGDSGGPSICRDDTGKAVLCGIVSFGGDDKNCTDFQTETTCVPNGHMALSHFHDWIVKTTGGQENAAVLSVSLLGEEVSDNSYDHQVTIQAKGLEYPCGGTLIEPDLVVTAAHCVATDDGKIRKSLKITPLKNGKEINSSITAKNVVVGDSFSARRKRKRLTNIKPSLGTDLPSEPTKLYKEDIALVRLRQAVDIDNDNLPKLSSKNPDDGAGAVELAFPKNSSFYENMLYKRDFKILDAAGCKKRIDRLSIGGYNLKYDENIICGVEKYSGGSLCDRQLGGALMCTKKKKEELCGIQVFRLCKSSIPSAFLSVANLGDWIENSKKNL